MEEQEPKKKSKAQLPKLEKQVKELMAVLAKASTQYHDMLLALTTMKRQRDEYKAMVQAALDVVDDTTQVWTYRGKIDVPAPDEMEEETDGTPAPDSSSV